MELIHTAKKLPHLDIEWRLMISPQEFLPAQELPTSCSIVQLLGNNIIWTVATKLVRAHFAAYTTWYNNVIARLLNTQMFFTNNKLLSLLLFVLLIANAHKVVHMYNNYMITYM